ncbi:maleylpyruvate isomerase family mycothiol-dependent enzyme [Streptomyces sp. NPDC050504]|uniref:maleylpyruvate isomerase family mycothiol-dependent enzyme n=1 Tax=Streptomyces sp. NPDC050504 TaxID=3365618 RepID=UPI00379260AE
MKHADEYVARFHREARDFEAALRTAARADAAPLVPSCPGWSIADLAAHLGGVHRFVARILRDRLQVPPDTSDLTLFELPADLTGWPDPAKGPHTGPLHPQLPDWFARGATALEELLRSGSDDDPVWSWSADHTAGFWLRVQTVEAAVHRWDAQGALGERAPIDAELAAEAVGLHFGLLVPGWRAMGSAPRGGGERFAFRRTDGGGGAWTVSFEGDEVRVAEGGAEAADVTVSGGAAELLLFLWGRVPAERMGVAGDRELLPRLFELAPNP